MVNYEDELLCAKAKAKAGAWVHDVVICVVNLKEWTNQEEFEKADYYRKCLQIFLNTNKSIKEIWRELDGRAENIR